MRRSVIALLTALAVVAVTPMAALAAPRPPSIRSITATVIEASGSTCDVQITVGYGPRKSTGTWDIWVHQFIDGAAQSGPYEMTDGRISREKFTFYDVTLGSHVWKWQVTAKIGSAVVQGPVYTSNDTWTTAGSCPAVGTIVATYP